MNYNDSDADDDDDDGGSAAPGGADNNWMIPASTAFKLFAGFSPPSDDGAAAADDDDEDDDEAMAASTVSASSICFRYSFNTVSTTSSDESSCDNNWVTRSVSYYNIPYHMHHIMSCHGMHHQLSRVTLASPAVQTKPITNSMRCSVYKPYIDHAS